MGKTNQILHKARGQTAKEKRIVAGQWGEKGKELGTGEDRGYRIVCGGNSERRHKRTGGDNGGKKFDERSGAKGSLEESRRT